MAEFCRNRSHRETHCWVQREDCPEAFSLASTTAFRDSREVLASIIVSSESSGPVKLTRMKPPTAARKSWEMLQKSHLERERTHAVDRGLIVRLIAETIAGMQKQDAEILKVFSDIKSVQRELKWVSQTLYRAFNPIEDVLFEDVEDRKGERAYKLFGRLHVSCLNSVEAIERNGALLRQNEELVDLVEAEQQRQFAQQLQRICRDAEDVMKENERLEELLK
ncbi:unnamed protein product [Nippostrongylus brasiliensis]|uniref:Coiled-coil domain-containing protein 22 homolog n=1 Tax=Nippostrongylus brasiliensis TaxID=27835 RepID=A0A0N4XVS0_NIPBR|nr:unnamed protein product [Nippostrongylus brasiliensis]